MNVKIFAVLGSVFGFLGVAIGAFAAHGLKNKLSSEMFQVFEVGVRYHMYHALALFAVAWAISVCHSNLIAASGWFFTFGIFIFSGSLYALALSGVKVWGALTPIGGLMFLAGWAALCFGFLKSLQSF